MNVGNVAFRGQTVQIKVGDVTYITNTDNLELKHDAADGTTILKSATTTYGYVKEPINNVAKRLHLDVRATNKFKLDPKKYELALDKQA